MASKTPRSDTYGAWLSRQRWFASKTRRIVEIVDDDAIPIGGAVIALQSVRLDDGSVHRYAVAFGSGAVDVPLDAFDDAAFCRRLLGLVADEDAVVGARGRLQGHRTDAVGKRVSADAAVRRIGGEQSNTSVAFDEAVIMKWFRHLTPGINPEHEMTQFLTERTPFRNMPRLLGHLEYRGEQGEPITLAVAQELITGADDGWRWMLREIAAFHARARESGREPAVDLVAAWAVPALASLRRLGERTGELHLALASHPDDPAFAPEPITPDDVAGWSAGVRRQLDAAAAALSPESLDLHVVDPGERLSGLLGHHKIRHHGDFHLGQTLYREAGADFVIIDFEGEPLRPLVERRRKHAAVRDVAGMLRSIDYAAVAGAGTEAAARQWAALWERAAAHEFLAGYRATTRGAAFVPQSEGAFMRAVRVFELEKAAYEVVYEANHRPDWVAIPRRGLVRAAAALRERPEEAGAA